MFLRMKPVSLDSHILSSWQLCHSALSAVTSAQKRMLGNNEHFYPGQDDKDGEDEEEEEEQGSDDRHDGGGYEPENGELEGVELKEMIGGRQSWDWNSGEVLKPSAVVVGRQRTDRPQRLANLGFLSNQASKQQRHHAAGANQQTYHQGPSMLQKRRALMERSMTTMAPLEDTFFTMMVFRIGIPDIKQTVGAHFRENGFITKTSFQ